MSALPGPALTELAALRGQLARSLGQRALELAGPTLAQLELLAQAEAPDPAESAPLLDMLEDLLEALMHEASWPEPSGGGT